MTSPATWFNSAENFLDERGKSAWIITMIVAFVIAWPIGLAILFYMLWSKRMCQSTFAPTGHFPRKTYTSHHVSSGNSAFDAYRDETIQRLENEQEAFQKFLEKLREAKDKAEFDQFLDDRAKDVEPKEE